jgi:hypothetical protein
MAPHVACTLCFPIQCFLASQDLIDFSNRNEKTTAIIPLAARYRVLPHQNLVPAQPYVLVQ